VSGKWSRVGDTVHLQSKYKASDFININQILTESDKQYFIYDTDQFCYSSDLLCINDTIHLWFECSSMKIMELDKVRSVRFVKYIDKTFLFEVELSSETGLFNVFTFNFDNWPSDKLNDSFFENEKLILKDNLLIPVSSSGLLKVDYGYQLSE
jgi:hypothetical protein